MLSLASCLLLGFFAAPHSRADVAPRAFAPITVDLIYAPRKAQSTADDALDSGQVVSTRYAAALPARKPWRVAFLFPHLKDPYWLGCNYGVINEARRLGIKVDILVANGYDDLVGQLHQMEEAIAANYDAIVISPISLNADNAAIARARAQGIPVFELANDSTSGDLNTKITTSLKSMGSDATRWLIEDAQKRGLKSINIALLPGPEDAGWVKGEVEGTRMAAAKAPIKVNIVAIKYGDSDRIIQSQLAAQVLAEHGSSLDYVVGCTGCAPAAILPLKAAGLATRVRIVAYDLTREIANSIRKGDIAAAADTKGVSQARVATNAVVSFLEAREQRTPHTILVRLGLVTQANFSSYDFGSSVAPEGYSPTLSYSPSQP